MIGFSLDEMVAMDMNTGLASVHADDLPSLLAAHARMEVMGKSNAEYRQRTKNGDYRWMSNRMSLTMDSAGRPLYRSGNIRDITESKKAEDALRESEEKYRSLFENLNSASILVEPILNGDGRLVDLRYLMANPSVKKHLGKTPDELVGKLYSEVFPYPGRNPVFDIYEKVLSSGESCNMEVLLPALNKHYDMSIYRPIAGRLALVMSDISERKKAEEKIQILANIVESSNDVDPLKIFSSLDTIRNLWVKRK